MVNIEIPDQLRQDDYRFIKVKEASKRPIEPNWQETNNYQYDSTELEDHLSNGKNYGVATGYGDLTVIDCDNKEVEIQVKEHLPETFTVRTGGGGAHFYYECPDIDKPIRLNGGESHGDVGDVQYKGKQVIGPNSKHPSGDRYQVEIDQPIANISINQIKTALSQWVDTDVGTWEEIDSQFDGATDPIEELSITDVVTPDNYERLHNGELQGAHPIHGSKTGVNFTVNPNTNLWHCFRHDSGGTPLHWVAVEEGIINCSQARSESLTGEKFLEVLEIAKDKYGLDVDLTKPDGDSDSKGDVVKIPSVVTDDLLAEQIKNDDGVKFAVWNKANKEIEYKDKIEINGKKIKPINDDLVEDGVIKLAEGPQEYESTNKLLDQINDFIKEWVDISEEFREIATWYVLLSWVYDRFSTIPYLRFHGDFGTGKTRALKTIGGICYKSVDTSGGTTSAAIERIVDRWSPTVLMNEADFYNSDTTSDMVKLLNEGFEKGGQTIKAHKEDQEKLVTTKAYSPKLLATREKWKDQALESRALTEHMQETDRDDILPVLIDEFRDKQQELRNKLLMFRFENYHKFDENKIKEIWTELQNMDLDRRLIQSTINFSVLFYEDKEVFERYKQFLRDRQKALREDRANSFEGGIVQAIYELEDQGIENITPSQIAEHMENELNRGYSDVHPPTIGKKIKNLGMETQPKRTDEGTRRVLITDEQTKAKIYKRYLPPDVTGVTGVTGVTDSNGGNDNVTDTAPKVQTALNKINNNEYNESDVDSDAETVRNSRNARNSCNTLQKEIIEEHKDEPKEIGELIDNLEYSEDEIRSAVDQLKDSGVLFEFADGVTDLNG